MSIIKICCLTLLAFCVTVEAEADVEKTGCQCIKQTYSCRCCADLKIPEIGLDDAVCVNLMYLPKDYGISFQLTFGKHVIINDTISARNPPPICADVPYLKQYASVCLDFYNLDISKGKFSGCLDLQARLAHIFVEKVQLGCWNIGNTSLESILSEKSNLEKHVEAIKQFAVARERKLKQLGEKQKDAVKKFIKL